MRRLALVVLLAALGTVAYLVLGSNEGDGRPRYVTVAVDRGPIRAAVTATGTVNPVKTVQVGTYVSGPIQEIEVDFNSTVQEGQLLAKIDPRPFQVKVDAAEAEVANARAGREKAKADAALKALSLERAKRLSRDGIISAAEVDAAVSDDEQARAQVVLAGAQVESAEAKVAEARVNLAYTDIVSPVDGVVVSRNVDVGQTVAASFQTPTLFLVAQDLREMQVNASVSESDIGGVEAGQATTFTVDAYPGVPFRGTVTQVRNAPITIQNVVTYEVIVGVDNSDLRLKPGMTANVTVATATRDDALRVPTAALRFRPPLPSAGAGAVAAPEGSSHASRVWKLDGRGEPAPVTIESGIADERFTEVTGGLQAGDRVIVGLERTEPAASAMRPPPFAPARRR
jgi:HlyD family secretion protein